MYLSHHHSITSHPSHHHPSPPHTTLLHAHPHTARTPTNNPATYLNRSKMELTVSSCVTCPVEALLHVRSIGYRLPGRMVITTNTPNATATTVRARGEVAQHGLPTERARHFGVEPTAPRALDSRPGGRSPSPRSRRTSSPCRRWLRTGSGYSFDVADSAVFIISTLGRA